jgi:hypothetical protein
VLLAVTVSVPESVPVTVGLKISRTVQVLRGRRSPRRSSDEHEPGLLAKANGADAKMRADRTATEPVLVTWTVYTGEVVPTRWSPKSTRSGLKVSAWIGGAATTRVKVAVASGAMPLLAVICRLKSPVLVGTPEIRPEVEFAVSPPGRPATVQVGAGLPVALRVKS